MITESRLENILIDVAVDNPPTDEIAPARSALLQHKIEQIPELSFTFDGLRIFY